MSNEVRLSQKRLIDSDFFYDAKVLIIPPKSVSNTRTISVIIQEGFRYRFGGDKAYGSFGMDNLYGQKKSYRIQAGINLFSVSYLDDLARYPVSLTWLPSFWGLNAAYMNSTMDEDKIADYNTFSLKFDAGYAINPDQQAGITAEGRLSFISGLTQADNGIVPSSINKDLVISAFYNSIFNYYPAPADVTLFFKPSAGMLFEIGGNSNIPLLTCNSGIKTDFFRQSIDFQASAGYAFNELPILSRFDLFQTPDLSVRAGYRHFDLLADRFVLFNLEYRFPVTEFFLPPFLNIKLKGFLYSDQAFLGNYHEASVFPHFFDGYGAGLRLIFDNPIFAYFSFSYGISH